MHLTHAKLKYCSILHPASSTNSKKPFVQWIFSQQIQEPCNGFPVLRGQQSVQKAADHLENILDSIKYNLHYPGTLNVSCDGNALQ